MNFPWLAVPRSQFLFYVLPAVPFMRLGIAAILHGLPARMAPVAGVVCGRQDHDRHRHAVPAGVDRLVDVRDMAQPPSTPPAPAPAGNDKDGPEAVHELSSNEDYVKLRTVVASVPGLARRTYRAR